MTNKIDEELIVLDVETTGDDPKHDDVIYINSCAITKDGSKIISKKYENIFKPSSHSVPPEFTSRTGISYDDMISKMNYGDMSAPKKIRMLCDRKPLVLLSKSIYAFLRFKGAVITPGIVDILEIAEEKFGERLDIDALSSKLGAKHKKRLDTIIDVYKKLMTWEPGMKQPQQKIFYDEPVVAPEPPKESVPAKDTVVVAVSESIKIIESVPVVKEPLPVIKEPLPEPIKTDGKIIDRPYKINNILHIPFNEEASKYHWWKSSCKLTQEEIEADAVSVTA